MNSQSAQTTASALASGPSSHLHFESETCPSCGQEIPLDKLAEIKGRIAVKERERTLAVTTELEKDYAIRQAQADSAAKAALESERRQSAARETKVREEAQRAAENMFNEKMAGANKSVAEANAKAREAESRASSLAQQYESAMAERLTAQRDIMEKAKEDALNSERAKAFAEHQKLSTKVNDLQRALEQKTAAELGEGAEVNIFDALKTEFPDDKIEHIAKGVPGADIRHVVMLRGQECGTILYDSKNHKQWREEHAGKLRRDQLAAKAEHAVLSTHKFPQGAQQLCQRDGVLLANPARVMSVVTIIRQHLLQLHTLRLSEVERESKTAALYEFIISARCKQLLDRIDQRAGGLLDLQEDEIKWHEKNWKHQGTAIRAIQKAKVDLETEIDSIIGMSADDAEISEVS